MSMFPKVIGESHREGTLGSLNRWAQDLMGPWLRELQQTGVGASCPVDVYERKNRYVIDAELPGFRSEDIDCEMENNVLRIRAERCEDAPEGKEHLRERRCSRVERSFRLPAEVDEQKMEANLRDGVLHIELPLKEGSKARKIEVKGE